MEVKREWFEKDYYAVLGVSPDATEKHIQKAYRKLARDLHPDQNPGDTKAEERFKDVSAAYDVIGDPATRSKYDEARRMGPGMGGFSSDFGGQLVTSQISLIACLEVASANQDRHGPNVDPAMKPN